MFEQLLNSLAAVFQFDVIIAMTLGLIGGIIFGAIPGLTTSIGISLLIPLTFGMSPLVALAILAGIHNGGSYGGAIPAILLRIPGAPGAIVTTFDGYPMAQQGFAAPPAGIILQTPEDLKIHKAKIVTAVQTGYMPLGNITQLTDAERQQLVAYASSL